MAYTAVNAESFWWGLCRVSTVSPLPPSLPATSLSSVPSSTSAFSKSNITTTTNSNMSWVGRRAAKKEMQCEELTDQMQNGMYHHTK